MNDALSGGGGAGGASRLTVCLYGTVLGGRAFNGSVLVAGNAAL